jgi:hypothetical protein
MDLVNFVSRHRCNQRCRDIVIGTEAALHHHRGARRNVIAEFGVSRKAIGVDGRRRRVILVETHTVAEVGPELH